MKAELPLVDLVVGTRPNIVKAAPLLHALERGGRCLPRLVFLAQHTQDAMTTHTFEDLWVSPETISRIDVGAGEVGTRVGNMVDAYCGHLRAARPALVVVFGDVDATFAATYAAKREHLPVAHVEAGLRSGDLRMPEEVNRRMVDGVSDVFFTTLESGNRNLIAEGVRARDIHFCGNLMVDSLTKVLGAVTSLETDRLLDGLHLEDRGYALATFHRPSNVDSADHLKRVIEVLDVASTLIPVVFPVHPRSAAALESHGLSLDPGRILVVPPIRYRQFVALLSRCRLVITDSGGLQEETSALGIPCLTFRENTERPETITHGTNRLVKAGEAGSAVADVLAAPMPPPCALPGWDGSAAPRIANVIADWLVSAPTRRAS